MAYAQVTTRFDRESKRDWVVKMALNGWDAEEQKGLRNSCRWSLGISDSTPVLKATQAIILLTLCKQSSDMKMCSVLKMGIHTA